MEMKFGICLLLVCEILGGKMLIVEDRVKEDVFELSVCYKIGCIVYLNFYFFMYMLE